jgi:16S rRNA A1518/A1519 N6-dimethyltransferase RsmA/KsgA/DIM1 with predicted DNA glycosylase/AP lyase activity
MTDSLKLLVALMYFDSKPENPKESGWEGLTMDYLALIFDRSKKTIHDCIKEKEAEAKKILEEAKLRKKAREIALRELIKEEKLKLIQETTKNI